MVGERRILATARLWRRPGTEPCQSVHTVCGCSLTVTAVLGITTETMRTTKESLSGLSSLPSSTLDNTVLNTKGTRFAISLQLLILTTSGNSRNKCCQNGGFSFYSRVFFREATEGCAPPKLGHRLRKKPAGQGNSTKPFPLQNAAERCLKEWAIYTDYLQTQALIWYQKI